MSQSKVWFITGASSGFGRILTEFLLRQGHRVVATLRKPEVLSDLVAQYPSTHLVVVKLDVTQRAEILAAFARAHEAFGRVDVVFNNAGKAVIGELESINDEDARELFEVNFWGAAQVTLEAVRFFRDVNQPPGGRLLQMSSTLAIKSLACCGYYSASKFALEGLTEGLVDELDPTWNTKITLLEPGPFRTDIFTRNKHIAPPHTAYTNPELSGSKWRALFQSDFLPDGDPQKACMAFESVSRSEDPPIRLPLHIFAIGMTNKKGESLIEVARKYKNWSDDLYDLEGENTNTVTILTDLGITL